MTERMLSLVPLAVLLWCVLVGVPPLLGSPQFRFQMPAWRLAELCLRAPDLVASVLWAAAIVLPVLAWTQGIKGIE